MNMEEKDMDKQISLTFAKTRDMAHTAMFVALIAAGAFIKIPVPAIPFTLQTLFTLLAGILLGAKRGCAAVCIYMFLGLAGVPIFAQGGGIGYVFQPSFGYIIGFAVGTFVAGKIAEGRQRPGFKRLLAANLVGLAIIYFFGLVYYYLISALYLKAPIGLWPLFLHGLFVTLPGDLALSMLGAAIGKRMIPLLREGKI